MDKELFVQCMCNSPEHQLIFEYLEEPDSEELFVSFHLNTYDNIFKRIWVAIKYVFGYRCKYGHWDEVVIEKEKAFEVFEFLKNYMNHLDKIKKD